jgi:phosphoglycerol transferase MdoB-like AlkP superfamily enzyme
LDRAINFLEKNIKDFLKDKFFLTAVTGTLLQAILFILLLSDGNAIKINFKTAIVGVPPILVYVSFVLIPYSFCFLLKGKAKKLFIIITNLLISLLLVFDLWYYRSNSSFLNYYMLDMTTNLEGLSSSIFAMFRSIDLIFFTTALILMFMFKTNLQNYKNSSRDAAKFMLLFFIPILYLGYTHIKIDKLQRGYAYQYIFRRSWSQNQTIYNLTPLGYHAYDFFNYLEDRKPYILTHSEEVRIDKYFNAKEKGLPDNRYAAAFEGKNLLVIQVESLESFIIKEVVGHQEITPNLNRLLNNSLYFSNYREQTYNGTTSDATYVSNTSMFPTLVGNNNFNYPYNEYNSLPNLLKKEGYNTYSMHGEKGTYWNWMTAEKNMGFDTTLDITEFKEDEKIGLGLSDRSFLTQALEKIEKQKKPFYSFMITLTSHSPFTIPEHEINIKLTDNLKGTRMGGFIESINYTDRVIGEFIETLDNKGMLEDTIVAIYGDHEGVSKFFDEEVKSLKGIPDKWKENDRRVPLIIYSKALNGEEFKANGGQVDFLPTMSYLMGIEEENYINTALGRNLLNTNLDKSVLTNRTYRGSDISEEKEQFYIDVLEISNIMIKSNYFKGRD